MLWFNKNAGADFAVAEISEYSGKLEKSISVAEDQYNGIIELSDKIRAALVEIVEVGENNLRVCESELEWCSRQEEVTKQKIDVIEKYIENIKSTIRSLDEMIAKLEASYKDACAQADRVRNTTVNNEAEEKARSAAQAHMQKVVNNISGEIGRLSGKRSSLYHLIQESEADISKLKDICAKLSLIDCDLKREKDRINSAIYEAEALMENLSDCERKLKDSFSKNIDGGLYLHRQSVGKALVYANEALALMSEINDCFYDDYNRVTVANVRALCVNARDMSAILEECADAVERMDNTCKCFESVIDDRIMDAMRSVLDGISQQQDDLLKYIDKKATRLENEFCDSLAKYCKVTVK